MAKIPSAPKQPVGGKTSSAPSKPSNKAPKSKAATMNPQAVSAPSKAKAKAKAPKHVSPYGQPV